MSKWQIQQISDTKDSSRLINCKFSKKTSKMIYLLSLNISRHDMLFFFFRKDERKLWDGKYLLRACFGETWWHMCIWPALWSVMDKISTSYILRCPERSSVTLFGEFDIWPWCLEGTCLTGWHKSREQERRHAALRGELKQGGWFRISCIPEFIRLKA